MQAIILAAGRSTRTYPLTLTRPKPLLKVCNKTLVEHNLDQLKGIVDEVIIIVGYKKEMLIKLLGEDYFGIKIKYIEQKEQLGSGHAVMLAEKYIREKFILMNSDDLFSAEDIKRCIEKDYALLAKQVPDPENFGVIISEKGSFKKIIEKPDRFISDLVNTGLYVLDKDIFSTDLKRSARGEYEATDYLNYLVASGKKIDIVRVSDYWLPIAYPWDLLDANREILERSSYEVEGIVENMATLKGSISVGKGTTIKDGAYIEGPAIIGTDCTIGPNCYIRSGTVIGDRCKIGNAVEIKNTIIYDDTNVGHLSYIGDSILGYAANMGAGTITANLRHDGKDIRTMVKGKLITTKRRKLGAVIADGVHTGIHTSIYPGRKIWPNGSTLPGQIVKKDIGE